LMRHVGLNGKKHGARRPDDEYPPKAVLECNSRSKGKIFPRVMFGQIIQPYPINFLLIIYRFLCNIRHMYNDEKEAMVFGVRKPACWR
jgi:hypothetical protein